MKGLTTFVWTLVAAIVLSCAFQTFLVATKKAAAMAPYEMGTNVGNTKPGAG